LSRDAYLVLSVGPHFNKSDFARIPENVSVSKHLPQLAILKRCDMMITHGGSSSIRECILLGIPMIVIPLGYESEEYARRVSHHELGIWADYRRLSARDLSYCVSRIRDDTKYKAGATRMKILFEDWEKRKPSLAALQACLSESAQ